MKYEGGMEVKQLDPIMVKVWRVHALIHLVLYVIALSAYSYVNEKWWHVGAWTYAAAAFVILAILYCEYTVFPAIRYRNFFYKLHEDEIEIAHGLFIVTHMIVPVNRVQYVKMKQGPIMKFFQLSSLSVSTASNTEEIPGLTEQEAQYLQKAIITLAKVEDDDE